MVDKIDKPDIPPLYTVKSPGETKGDKQHEERGQEDLPTFQKEQKSLYQEKFQGGLGPSQTFKVPLEKIQKMIFKRALPFHGTPTAEADLFWVDGRVSEQVSFLLRNWQDFLRLKNFRVGEMIPPTYWNYTGTELEITIRQKTQTSGSWNIQGSAPSKAPIPTPQPKSAGFKWNARKLAIAGAALLIGLSVLVYILTSF